MIQFFCGCLAYITRATLHFGRTVHLPDLFRHRFMCRIKLFDSSCRRLGTWWFDHVPMQTRSLIDKPFYFSRAMHDMDMDNAGSDKHIKIRLAIWHCVRPITVHAQCNRWLWFDESTFRPFDAIRNIRRFHYSLMREIHNKIIIFCVILDMSIGHHRYSQLLKSLEHRTVSILGQGCSAILNWLAICLLLKREWRHRARISRKLDQYQLFSMYSIGNYHF